MGQTPKTFAQKALNRASQIVWAAPANITADLITDVRLSNNTKLDNPLSPTITNQGTTGTTTYTYYIVANDAWGGKTLVSSSGSTTTGNATLNTSNYNIITWTPVLGAVSYDILKGGTTTSLVTATQGTVSGSNLTYNDQGSGTSAYTAPTVNNTGIRAFVSLHHVLSGGSLSLTNREMASYEVDPGFPTTVQTNIVMASGDTIQASVNSGATTDAAIDGMVSISVRGVEYS